jgi:hypothetical protein
MYIHEEEKSELDDCLSVYKLRVADLELEVKTLKLSSFVVTQQQETQADIAEEVAIRGCVLDDAALLPQDVITDVSDILAVPDCPSPPSDEDTAAVYGSTRVSSV